MASFEEIQKEIASMLDLPDEELSDGQREAMDKYLDMLADQEAAKVDGFAGFLKMETARAKACREEADRLEKKARASESRIKWLKARYIDIMMRHGLKTVRGEVYTLSVRKSEVVFAPEDAARLEVLSVEYPLAVKKKVKYEPNKPVIRDLLKGGYAVPACELAESFSLTVR